MHGQTEKSKTKKRENGHNHDPSIGEVSNSFGTIIRLLNIS